MLGNLIGGFVVILVGVNLAPVVGTGVVYAGLNTTANLSAATTAILGLTTIFFCLGVMAAGISVATNGLKQAGLI
jgi:hypothetical protein